MEGLTLASIQRPTGFLDLPYEIRLQIYKYCLPQNTIFNVSYILHDWYRFHDFYVHDLPSHDAKTQELGNESHSFLSEDDQPEAFEPVYDSSESHLGSRSALPSLLQVSRQISDEALNVLYGGNVFKIDLHGPGQDDLKRVFCEANRRRIRHIMLVLRPMGVSYDPGFKVDEVMWNIILPHLIYLWIVAEQPLEDDYDYYWNGQTLEQKMKEWIEWLTPILECLAKMLSAEPTVLVDIDEREETVKLIRGYLRGCRQVRTKTGDFIFKRGEFSIESGYWDDDRFDNCRDIYDYDSD